MKHYYGILKNGRYGKINISNEKYNLQSVRIVTGHNLRIQLINNKKSRYFIFYNIVLEIGLQLNVLKSSIIYFVNIYFLILLLAQQFFTQIIVFSLS